MVAAWTFDDRMGIVALLRMLDEIKRRQIVPHTSTIVAFTVHEEGGGHGAKVLAHREGPEVFVAVDGCPTLPGSQLTLDGRPAIWSMDQVGHYDQRLIGAFRKAAERIGVDLQVAVYEATASDAGLVYASGGAPRVACLGHVRDNSHGYEVARVSVFDRLMDTLVSFVDGWDGE